MSELDKINKNFVEKLNKIKTKEDLQNLKSEFLGKNGFVTNEFKKMSQLNLDQKKEFSIQLNEIKNSINDNLSNKLKEIEKDEINKKLSDEKIDITLPIRSQQEGKIHPVSQVIDEISSIFSEIGYSVAEGPDVETEHNNFTALYDKGYHNGSELKKAEELEIKTIVAIPNNNGATRAPDERYFSDKFIYNKQPDTYTCPQGQTLTAKGNWTGIKWKVVPMWSTTKLRRVLLALQETYVPNQKQDGLFQGQSSNHNMKTIKNDSIKTISYTGNDKQSLSIHMEQSNGNGVSVTSSLKKE